MSPLGRSLTFLAIYVVYLLAGGYMFSAIECPEEKRAAMQERVSRELIILLSSHLKTIGEFLHDETQKSYYNYFLNMKQEYNNIYRKNPIHKVESEGFQCKTWNVYNSVFFSFTCITTIGFGTQTPTTQAGRGACILYSIIGIPINSILIFCIGNFYKDQESTKNR